MADLRRRLRRLEERIAALEEAERHRQWWGSFEEARRHRQWQHRQWQWWAGPEEAERHRQWQRHQWQWSDGLGQDEWSHHDITSGSGRRGDNSGVGSGHADALGARSDDTLQQQQPPGPSFLEARWGAWRPHTTEALNTWWLTRAFTAWAFLALTASGYRRWGPRCGSAPHKGLSSQETQSSPRETAMWHPK